MGASASASLQHCKPRSKSPCWMWAVPIRSQPTALRRKSLRAMPCSSARRQYARLASHSPSAFAAKLRIQSVRPAHQKLPPASKLERALSPASTASRSLPATTKAWARQASAKALISSKPAEAASVAASWQCSIARSGRWPVRLCRNPVQ